jgi:hypothetical protein
MTTDPYREWDGAYVMGSLSPSERREYEQHLSTCAGCTAEVAALAGMSGILSSVQPDAAMALLPGPPPVSGENVSGANASGQDVPASLLPKLLESAMRSRRRARRRVAVLVAAAAAVAAAVALVVPRLVGDGGTPEPAGQLVAMAQAVPSPITAEAVLYAEPWGTRIQVVCWYAESTSAAPPRAFHYALYVTDSAGTDVQVASWTASAGSRSTPVATTGLLREEIDSIDIRLVDTGTVLLRATP